MPTFSSTPISPCDLSLLNGYGSPIVPYISMDWTQKVLFKKSSALCLPFGFMSWSAPIQFASTNINHNDVKPVAYGEQRNPRAAFTNKEVLQSFVVPFKAVALKATFELIGAAFNNVDILSGADFGGHPHAVVLAIKDSVSPSAMQWLGQVIVTYNGVSNTYPLFAGEDDSAPGNKILVSYNDQDKLIDDTLYRVNGGQWQSIGPGELRAPVGSQVQFKIITKQLPTAPNTAEVKIKTNGFGDVYLTAQSGAAKTLTSNGINVTPTPQMAVEFLVSRNL